METGQASRGEDDRSLKHTEYSNVTFVFTKIHKYKSYSRL